MTDGFGAQSMTAPLRRVVMRRPGEEMAAADPAAWHYTGPIDLGEAREAHDAFARMLRAWGVEVLYHEEPLPGLADSVFVFDPVLVTDRGTLLLSMGKEKRRGEEEPLGRTLQACGVPLYGRLEGDARAEGGDTMWLDHDTLAVGRGFRTNAEGVRQLRGLLEPLGVSVLDYDLPFFTGPEACLHLLSVISPVDRRPGRRLPAAHAGRVLGRASPARCAAARSAGGGVLAHAGHQRAVRGAAPLHHAGRQPGDEAAAGGGGLRGADVSRGGALVEVRGRPHVPHPSGVAAGVVSRRSVVAR